MSGYLLDLARANAWIGAMPETFHQAVLSLPDDQLVDVVGKTLEKTGLKADEAREQAIRIAPVIRQRLSERGGK